MKKNLFDWVDNDVTSGVTTISLTDPTGGWDESSGGLGELETPLEVEVHLEGAENNFVNLTGSKISNT